MSTASVKPGDVLAGKYRVERVLGAGGMGYVVAARHLQLDQLVAMKFLRKAAVENAEAGTRFLREAKAVVRLKNEHVAKVFDVGTLESGEPYIVMEHLDGCDLAAMAKEREVLPVGEVCEYVLQACEALAEAHSLGIIHRDIKLANLFVTRGQTGGPLVKLLDFGISKTNPFGESEHDMTRTASMLGSPRFMSPEQMRDPRAVDGRSDIWSLGVVIYRLVAGRPPFEAETLGRLLTMVMHEPEPLLSSVRPDVPHGFDHVVARCLQKDPALRFSNVAELAYSLVAFAYDPGRARAAADRIATMLSIPMSPLTGDRSMPLPLLQQRAIRVSSPPGASDTPAPWAGTQPGVVRQPAAHGSAIWLGVALASILAGSGIFAMIQRNAAAAAARPPSTLESPRLASAPAPLVPPADPTPPIAPSPPLVAASPLTVPSVATPPPSPRAEGPAAPRRVSAAPARVVRPGGPGPRPGDGIPTTRD